MFGIKPRAATEMSAAEYQSARKVFFRLKRRAFVTDFLLMAGGCCAIGITISIAAAVIRGFVAPWGRLAITVAIVSLITALVFASWNFLFSAPVPRKPNL